MHLPAKQIESTMPHIAIYEAPFEVEAALCSKLCCYGNRINTEVRDPEMKTTSAFLRRLTLAQRMCFFANPRCIPSSSSASHRDNT